MQITAHSLWRSTRSLEIRVLPNSNVFWAAVGARQRIVLFMQTAGSLLHTMQHSLRDTASHNTMCVVIIARRCAHSCWADGAGPDGATPTGCDAGPNGAADGPPCRCTHTRHVQHAPRLNAYGGGRTAPGHTHGDGSSSCCCKRRHGDGCAAGCHASSTAGYDAWCCRCCCCCDGHGGDGSPAAGYDGTAWRCANGCHAAAANGSRRASRCAADA
jgi:hypothetical protein